ncbi:MAG: aromatic ring-hydroxylating dioxygenase subunit alpha [Candidatus Sericytochromatia bacterium]
MLKETETGLIERILAHLEHHSTDMLPQAARQPSQVYVSEAAHQAEHRFLRQQPVIVGHVSQLEKPGDFTTFEELETPLILSKTATGEIKVLVNVCRHRGTRIVNEAAGSRKRSFVCPYHGWTYLPDGSLLHIPHDYGFPDCDKAQLGLVSLPVAVHAGFVWTVLDPQAELDLPAFLGPLYGELDTYGFDHHFLYRPRVMERQLNWKLAIDIFLEGYHVQRAHAKTIARLFLDNVGLYDSFRPHLRNVFPKRTIAGLKDLPHQDWELRKHANILYHLFPNTLVLVQPDHCNWLSVYPQGSDKTRIYTWNVVSTKPETESAIAYWDKNIEILYDATDEDFALGESIQSGIRSGANPFFQFGRYEMSLQYFHATLEEEVNS